MRYNRSLYRPILFCIFFISTHAFGQTTEENVVKASKNINYCYEIISHKYSGWELYEAKYFEVFPNNFADYVALYGYDKNDRPGVLADSAFGHVDIFFRIKSIPDTVFYAKIILIALDGKWQVDGVNYFKRGLMGKVRSNPKLTVYLLKELNPQQQMSFWRFYFDGPHQNQEALDEIKPIKHIDAKMYDILFKAWKYDIMESKEEH